MKQRIISVCLWILAICMVCACGPILTWAFRSVGGANPVRRESAVGSVMPAYNMYVNNLTSRALDGLLSVPKVYWLAEDVTVAPKPDPDCAGSSSDPADAVEVWTQAKEMFGMERTIFDPEAAFKPGSTVDWYLDETIFSISWKQVFRGAVFSFSEIKIAHPSQFRRYLADNTFASPIQYYPSEMAATVNAVTAMSADFYKHRVFGTVVYQRQLYRTEGRVLDVLYVDSAGNLIPVSRGTLLTEEETQHFIDNNDILFSICFGPTLIQNGERAVPWNYVIGEIDEFYPRAAICQVDDCHYLLVASNTEAPYWTMLDIWTFYSVLEPLGLKTAYTMDGGQTASMYVNGNIFNNVSYGGERTVSDIIYFATAIPDEGFGKD